MNGDAEYYSWYWIIPKIGELDLIYLRELQAEHPRSAIRVTRGFFDGTEPSMTFGSVPNDWDGSVLVYEFRMVP